MLAKIKTYIIIVFISTLFSLYICEGYLIILNYYNSLEYRIKLYKKKTGKEYDTRSILEVYNKEKKNHQVAIRYLPSLLINNRINKKYEYDLFPLSGVSNINTINCSEEGYLSFYNSDRYGFNNPDEVWEIAKIDYILIGDSFVHGECVNRPDDISSVIRDLTGKSAINLGYRRNGPLIEYATLREYFIKPAKNIIWIYYEDDLENLSEELTNTILLKYLNDNYFSQNLKLKQDNINLINKEMIKERIKDIYNLQVVTTIQSKKNMKLKNKILKFIRLNYLKNFLKDFFNNFNKLGQDLPYKKFEQIIKKTHDLALKKNSNFYFVYLPSIKNYKTINFKNTPYKKVKSLVENLNIKFIDLNVELFKKHKNPLNFYTFKKGPHLTVEGYKEVANTIIKIIEKN